MIWYPYEQLKTMKAPYEIVDATGCTCIQRIRK